MTTDRNIGFSIKVEGDKRLLRKLTRDPMARPAMTAFMGKVGADLESKWKQRVRVDTGRYRNTIAHKVLRAFGARRSPAVIVQSRVNYAIDEEEGTKPRWLPWGPGSPLARWARRHGVAPFVVALKIARYGTRGSKAAYRSVRLAERTTIPRFVRELARDVGRDWESNNG